MKKIKIFKNRGNIYIPEAKFKSDLEQRILLIILAFIVLFTTVFLLVFGIKYNFSIKEFFTPDDLKNQNNEVVQTLPKVEGKTNFLFVLSNKNTEEMYLCVIIQCDMDSVSYKVCALSPDTVIENSTFLDIYSSSGAAEIINNINSGLGIDIDYYIDESYDDFESMFDEMGSVNYTVLNDVKYKDTSRYGYNIKIKAGDQKINGDTAQKLMRYYVSEEKNYSAVNDIILSAMSQQINETNFDKREKLFSKFIDYSNTNVTVKNFTESFDDLRVLSSETTGVNVYNCSVQYDGDNIISSSVDDIKGYFIK
ncbi:MAG: LCP family protein [Clostridiales bacterium]|nr:LCP family protein [Clostridiales bacterium]